MKKVKSLLFMLKVFTTFALLIYILKLQNIVKFDSLNIFIFVIIIFSIVIQLIDIYRNKCLKINWQSCLLSLLLVCIFNLMLPIKNFLNSEIFQSIPFILGCLYIVLFVQSLFHVFCFCLNCEFDNQNNIKYKYIMDIIIVICIIFIFTSTTGYYDYDSYTAWELISNKWEWNAQYPPIFWILMLLCKVLFNNPYLIVIINFFLFVYYCNYSFEIFTKMGQGKKISFLFFSILVLMIVPFDQLRYLNKDTIFSLAFCILLLSIFDYLLFNKITNKIKINIFVCSFLVLTFRYGSILLLFVMFFSIIIYFLFKKMYLHLKFIIINCLFLVIINAFINYLGFNVFKMKHYYNNYAYAVPIYQIAAFLNKNYEFNASDLDYLNNHFYLPIEYMKKNFTKGDGDKLSRHWKLEKKYVNKINDYNYYGLIKININLFKKYPIFYTQSLLEISDILWDMSGNEEVLVDNYLDGCFNNNWTKVTILGEYIDKFVNNFLKSFLFKIRAGGGFSMFIIIMSFFILIYKKSYKLLFPFFLIFFWYFLLILTIPLSVTRYCLPFINICPFILCLSLGIKQKEENQSLRICAQK